MSKANIFPNVSTPLYDTETEQALLSLFFISKKDNEGRPMGHAAFLDAQAAGLRAEHFYRMEHRLIYETAKKTFDAGQMIDIVIATQALLPKIPEIISLLGLITQKSIVVENAAIYAQKIIELGKRREIAQQAEKMARDAADLDKPIDEIKQGVLLSMAADDRENTATEPTCTDVMQMFAAEEDTPHYPTGLQELDKILDGGLYPGLYIVGAISSLGKTTLCLQIGDHIAAQGQDVLVFSLEMAKRELVAKSLSRLMAAKDRANAKTTRAILQGQKNWNPAAKALLMDAIAEYADGIGQHLYISVGMGDITPDTVRAAVVRHHMKTGRYPIVIIDYVQILAPLDARATDKQNIDKAVLELKRISRDFDTPVIGISSFNRDNYTAPVNMAAFKESGSLEYSSDVLIGLQYDFMEPREGETKEKRAARIEKDTRQAVADAKEGKPVIINAKILKNRNGGKGTAILQFTPKYNEFKDVDGFTHGEFVEETIIPR